VAGRSILITDGEGGECELDAAEADQLWRLAGALDPATVSACPSCRSRVLASVAFVDLLVEAPPFSQSGPLRELAEDAPTLHCYVIDSAPCAHRRWRDPGRDEWERVGDDRPRMRRP